VLDKLAVTDEKVRKMYAKAREKMQYDSVGSSHFIDDAEAVPKMKERIKDLPRFKAKLNRANAAHSAKLLDQPLFRNTKGKNFLHDAAKLLSKAPK
jgi:hypothetical protein